MTVVESSRPRVSVCIPAYQAGAYLKATLDSVWAQDYRDYEVVVIDDGSTDETPAVLAAQKDPRLRVFRHQRNEGQARTVTDGIALARGELVKFLDADDMLREDCLGKMVAALDERPSTVFVFSRRDVLLDGDDPTPGEEWLASGYADLTAPFGELSRHNDGAHLIARYAEGGFSGNWIAEPAGVMARRSDVLAVGGLSQRVRLATDMDMWLRLMTRGDVAFLDEPLYVYRFAFTGMTGESVQRGNSWLDALWSAEGLVRVTRDRPGATAQLARRVRRQHFVTAARVALSGAVRRLPGSRRRLIDLGAYVRFRVERRLGIDAPLHATWTVADQMELAGR